MNGGEISAGKQRGRPFPKGQSGNPAGKPKGARHRATQMVEALFEGQAAAIASKCVALALEGDAVALRLVMERLAPVRRGRPVRFPLPPLDTAADLPQALAAVLAAIADGAVTPDEGVSLAQIIESRRRAIEAVALESRIAALEQAQGQKS